MKMIEGPTIEFKELDRITSKLPESIAKEVCAFANTDGGTIYIGVTDDGSIYGIKDADDTMTRLTNTLRNNILPNIMPFVKIEPVEVEEKTIIKSTINIGSERPYYLTKEGLKPGGVFVRVGSSCQPLNENAIRQMIIETSGKSYEECRSINQDLTFEAMNKEMLQRNLEFGMPQMETMKMIGSDGLYTNLALLLSDQCPFSIKIAIFQGADNAIFRDRKEFNGSLFQQLEDAYKFIDFYNKTQANFNELLREDSRDYPPDALREALLNSIIHRDYLFSASNIINIYEDKAEIISLGGLVKGISMEAVYMGVSQSRNPNLAAVFYRLKLVESYGTGIRKINRLYNNDEQKPEFTTSEGGFSVVLPNKNYTASTKNPKPKITTPIDGIETKVYQLAVLRCSITRKDIELELNVGSTKAYKILTQLCKNGLLRQNKNGKLTTYSPKQN